ncbi:MAG: hypothetical protein ACXAB7_02035 [Candidatus Kariarchaeaceae archaeon]|jgi:hypothetical protein
MSKTDIETITPNPAIPKTEMLDEQKWKEIEKENEFYMEIIYQLSMAA